MLNTKIKKGFSLIEVMCSLTVFSILFIQLVVIQVNNNKLKYYNYKMNEYVTIMEFIKNDLIYNSTYEEIIQLKNSNNIYITNENLKLDTIKKNNILNLFTNIKPHEENYLVLHIHEKEKLNLNLKIYGKVLNKNKIIECNISKEKDL
ncbi:hypothetical protein CLOACE_01820 [Clostridium acetireducens DSM 10703]|uniref:Prepilin-type N-terminal cleavage/methylation domain-containing protein n=1 Tax=Clostridium acetireducens DSM 10703 TaxID=1121290 RepID=A0A1E8F1R6_9CLOT|nr:prepilin-type N-terminal cleavage/methylation domain-containing protein [Clostridium acetireducens]OFI07578.1 hypothetical protein CLOACE_01820 [Clostridium acetireducens DSM 10703]